MAKSTDWMPGPRAEILGMCAKWMAYMTEERRTAWGVPAAEYTALGNLLGAAQALFMRARDEAERTHVITVRCQAAF
jgi:hypothetical protein